MGIVDRLFGTRRDWYRYRKVGAVWHLSKVRNIGQREVIETACGPYRLSSRGRLAEPEHVRAVTPKGKRCQECLYRNRLATRPRPTATGRRVGVQDEEAEWAAGRIPKRYLLR